MLRSLALLAGLTLFTTGCALIPPSHPDLAYYPSPRDPGTVKISQTLYRAARAAGDDPDCYSFALIQTTVVTSFAAANPPASPFLEQRILAREPDLEDRLAALEPLEPTTFVAVRKAATRR